MANSLGITMSPQRFPAEDLLHCDKVCKRKSTASKEARKLKRLVALDKGVQGVHRSEMLLKLKSVWDSALKMLQADQGRNLKDVSEKIQTQLSASNLPESVKSIYQNELKGDFELYKKITSFKKDVSAIPCEPVVVSTRGNKGPTLLVSYTGPNSVRKYVIKWCSPNEALCSKVYSAFATCFDNSNEKCVGFHVPPFGRIDFSNKLYESASGQISDIKEFSESLRKEYLELTRSIHNKDPEDDHITLTKRVRGKNLLDFAYLSFSKLTDEQIEKFFERLARLSMLDLILGNGDRLSQIFFDGKTFTLEDACEVNLGNVMVTELIDDDAALKDFRLSAIDNGIDEELITDPKAREAYLVFLERLFNDPDSFGILLRNFSQCFRNALNSQVDEIKSVMVKNDAGELVKVKANIAKIKEDLKPITNSLQKEEVRESIMKGFRGMAKWLHQKAIPELWAKSDELKAFLHESNPNFYESINQRLEWFAKIPAEILGNK